MQDTSFVWPDLSGGLVPIVIGVTGHRFLRDRDTEKLEDKVGGIFSRLRKDFPHSPLILLTPLAEGAGRPRCLHRQEGKEQRRAGGHPDHTPP